MPAAIARRLGAILSASLDFKSSSMSRTIESGETSEGKNINNLLYSVIEHAKVPRLQASNKISVPVLDCHRKDNQVRTNTDFMLSLALRDGGLLSGLGVQP